MKQFFRHKRFLVTLPILLLLIGGGVFWYAKTAFGVTRTWDGGGTDGTCGGAGTANNWSCAANWSADTAPTASDIATFDATSTKNATINANISVAGINIAAGYSGTITQSSTYTVTVGASNYVQAAGTFSGGSGAITVNGTFTLSSGIFTSTSANLTINNGNTSGTLFTVSGVESFVHGDGTVTFTSTGGSNVTQTIDVNSSLTLNAVVINGFDNGDTFTTASGDTIIIESDLTHTNGAIGGTWEVQGNIIVGAGSDGGDGTVTYTTSGSHTYTYSAGGVGPYIRVNHMSANITPSGGTTSLYVYAISVLAGSFTAPSGTLTINSANYTGTVFSVASGATFNHNNGTIIFTGTNGSNVTQTIDVNSSLTLNAVVINGFDNGDTFTTASGDTIIIESDLTHTNGAIGGTWEVQGNYTVATTADGGTAAMTFTGGNNQTYTDSGGNEVDGDVTVNKSGGTVTLASNADWNATNQDLIITGGTLSSTTFNITTTNFTVNGGTFTGGSGTVTTAGPMLVSSGTFTGGAGNIDVNNTFTLSGGTFTAPSGTLEVGYGSAGTFFTVSGGVFNHNNGTVQLRPNGLDGGATTYTVDVSTSLALYNVVLNLSGNLTNKIVTTAAGDTIIAGGNFTHTNAKLNGTWEVKGNTTIATTADGGTATFSFTGPNDQTYTDQGGDEPNGNITINKPVGTVLNLASNADWNSAGQTTTITSGILNLGAYNLYTGGTLTVGANGVLHNFSTGDLILGGTVSNSGIIRLESSGSCGSTDAISITSSSNGVQRAWSGSGVYTLWDTSIQDQGGTAKIQVNSGTSVSGNGTNFVFNSACNFTNNTTSLTNGLVGYWPMEENTGTSTADMSGNGNTGTLNNGATWTTGQIGNATNFDGANDFIALQDSSVFDFGGAGSFCHWFYSTTFQNGIGMFSQDVSGAPSHKWLTYITGSSGLLAVYIRISGTAYSAVGPSKTAGYYDNAWHHICGTFDKILSSNRLKIYIDGNYAGASDAIAGDVDAGSYPSLGMWYGNSYFTGRLDEVRIYNRALTAVEVQQLYYNVRPSSAKIPGGKFQITNSKLKLP